MLPTREGGFWIARPPIHWGFRYGRLFCFHVLVAFFFWVQVGGEHAQLTTMAPAEAETTERNSTQTGNGGTRESAPVRVVQTYRVQPGCESAWEEAIRAASHSIEGQSEFTILPPTESKDDPSDNNWRVGRKFEKVEQYDDWWDSDARQSGEQMIAGWLLSPPAVQVLTGMGSWHAPDNGQKTITPPPRWKQVILGFCSFFPLSLGISYALDAIFGKEGLPLPVKTLILTAILLPLDKYAVSSLIGKIAAPWLYPSPKP